jgi:hypothetical protein
MRHFAMILFPVVKNMTNEKPFGIPEYEEIGIAWTMERDTNDEERWVSTDYYSTLPNIWIPDGGADFFQQLMLNLKERWLELCSNGDQHLTNSVSSYIFVNPS